MTDPVRALIQRLWKRDIVRAGVGAAVLTLVYFLVPIPDSVPGAPWRYVAVGALLIGLIVLVVRHLHGQPSRTSNLLLLLHAIMVVFSLIFYTISLRNPEEFVGLETRIDALYFTLTTMTTTGYGDIVAVGQTARSLVIAVFAFDIIFLSLLVGEIGQSVRERRHRDSRKEDGEQ
ncbi:voltage-gated potassium channel [Arthrobacter sp. AG1021]|uniref:ion channel n=1 Tax=Arthrobacter sp. AG1021 TaxID=2183908 RepID=UPI000EAE2B1A|nr:ion channel [Arthrobacter sp. AG1021]RKS18074.1 voltage-gated potassium channel [Arthrobacter sp. AG1021]